LGHRVRLASLTELLCSERGRSWLARYAKLCETERGVIERISKLAAILAADVVGFSRLTGADEDRTLARLRALRSDLIDPTIAVHNGRVFKRTGDGVLVEFRSVVDAVAAPSNGKTPWSSATRASRKIAASISGSAFMSATSSRRATATLWVTASRACAGPRRDPPSRP
jgi:class 3 adenylate cyclase